MLTSRQRDVLAGVMVALEKDNWDSLEDAIALYQDYRKIIEEVDINALDQCE